MGGVLSFRDKGSPSKTQTLMRLEIQNKHVQHMCWHAWHMFSIGFCDKETAAASPSGKP